MYKYIMILLGLAFFSSCCGVHTEIIYRCNGTVIKRVDECGKSTFYYGDIGKKAIKIWAVYSGINDGFSGYLKFEDNGKVLLLSGDGYFQTANNDTSKFEYRRITAYERPTLGKSVYYITLSTRYEKERNLGTDTDINVEYNIYDDEYH